MSIQPREGDGSVLLEVRDLAVSYAGALRALRGVSMEVPEGAVLAVLGANGAGKSTLLRAISGTLPLEGGSVDEGSVFFEGREISAIGPAEVVRAGVVQVPEGRRIFGELTVEENLRAGAITVRSGDARKRAYERVVSLFPRLGERRRQRAVLLSGGEQQMLAIGRALMAKPDLILMDEPSEGLAPQIVAEVGRTIARLKGEGLSIVLVEQNIKLTLELADDIVILNSGSVVFAGAARDIKMDDAIVAQHLGVH